MYIVIENIPLAPQVAALVVTAEHITDNLRPGQFVLVRRDGWAVRLPATVADADAFLGTVTLVIQRGDACTCDLAALRPGDAIREIDGPMGKPTPLLDEGHALCIGDGVGAAIMLPLVQALTERGVRVTSVIGARSDASVIFTDRLRQYGEVTVFTDDGSTGQRGGVTNMLAALDVAGDIDAVYAVGPVLMMHAVTAWTRPLGIPTTVSLNPVMIDGVDCCGGCRVSVGGAVKHACVDGPAFNGHQVDFQDLTDRLVTYRGQAHQVTVQCPVEECLLWRAE